MALSGIILTEQGQPPGEQAANELQMSGPKCLAAGGRSAAGGGLGLAGGGMGRTRLPSPARLTPRLHEAGATVSPQGPWLGWLFQDLEKGREAGGQRHFEHLGTISSSFKTFLGPELVFAPR